MPAVRLETRRVEKPWGRTQLWGGFADVPEGGEPVGEVWFEAPAGEEPALLVKYLFTSATLSIQVHPDDAAARARGLPCGKDEAWLILDAAADACIGLGLREATTREHLRAAALDGSIESLVDWRGAKADDVIYSPAGTIHALGPGLTLIEVQQNVDVTYRLYDHGRPRELHLEDGIAVANPVPYVATHVPEALGEGRMILAAGPAFVLERWSMAGPVTVRTGGEAVWLIPVSGSGTVDGSVLGAGETWIARGDVALTLDQGIDLLVAYPGAAVAPDMVVR